MVDSKLFAYQRVCFSKYFLVLEFVGLGKSQVNSQGVLVLTDRPNVKVVNQFNSFDLVQLTLNFIIFYVFRRSLEEYRDASTECLDRRVEHDESEEVGAEGVDPPRTWPDQNDRASDDYTN